jgi:hypothetical protein
MGWQNIFAPIFEAGNRIILNFKGLFVYNGTPRLGNLIASIVNTTQPDGFGNTAEANIAVYGSSSAVNTAYAAMSASGGIGATPAIIFDPLNSAFATILPQVFGNNLNGNTVAEQEGAIITSGKAGSDDMAIQLFSESFDTTIQATHILEAGGTQLEVTNKTNKTFNVPVIANAGTTINVTNITSDTWHQATVFNNGWTAQNAGFWYRLTNDKELEILADLNGGPAGNSSIITFTGIYVPNLGQNHPAGQNNVGGTSPPWIFVSNAGVINATGVPVAGEEIFFHIWIPVNLVNGGRG